jgi:Zn-dependent protease
MGRYSLRDKLILAAIVALFVWYYLLRGQTFGPELFTTFESYLFLGVALILAVTFHEFSHATVALLLGDRTAQMLGRVTLNPIRHLDLYGTLAFVFFHFGWGKPTPINPYNMKGVPPLVGAAITAIAGPISNVVFAILATIPFRLDLLARGSHELLFFQQLLTVNILLAAFNFLPIPPLDGFSLVRLVLPRNISAFLEQYGFMILIALIFVPQFLGRQFDFLSMFIRPIQAAIQSIVFAGL